MHTPWLQIANEVVEINAPQLGAELDVSEGDAFLMLTRFVKWGLKRCPEDRPPSRSDLVSGPSAWRQLAQAMQFTGDLKLLSAAMQRLPYPMVEVLPDGVRIRGLKRYDSYWRNAYPRLAAAWATSHPEDKPASRTTRLRIVNESAPPDPDPDPDPDVEPDADSNHHRTPDVAEDPVVVGNEFWRGIAVVRKDHGVETPDRPPKFDAWAVRQKRAGFTPMDVQVAHALYVRDADFKKKRWPIAIFMSPKVCDSRLKRHRPDGTVELENVGAAP